MSSCIAGTWLVRLVNQYFGAIVLYAKRENCKLDRTACGQSTRAQILFVVLYDYWIGPGRVGWTTDGVTTSVRLRYIFYFFGSDPFPVSFGTGLVNNLIDILRSTLAYGVRSRNTWVRNDRPNNRNTVTCHVVFDLWLEF